MNTNKTDFYQIGENDFETIVLKRIPVKVVELPEILEVGIINAKILLLILEGKLWKLNCLIDFKEGTLQRKTGQIIKLRENVSGHLMMNLVKNLQND